MGWSFWSGILIGFILSVLLAVGLWAVTMKILVPDLRTDDPLRLHETENDDGTWSYRFEVSNIGRRHAVDVEFSCTLFSQGWASDPDGLIATIALPVTTGRIGIMPAHRSRRNRRHPLNFVGPRVVTFRTEISEFQAGKLPDGRQQDGRDGKIRLGELMDLGCDSLISITVYAFDSFSGSRNVFTEATATATDIVAPHV
jgi:hypothetical protein